MENLGNDIGARVEQCKKDLLAVIGSPSAAMSRTLAEDISLGADMTRQWIGEASSFREVVESGSLSAIKAYVAGHPGWERNRAVQAYIQALEEELG
jgi:hypothetical protein